MWANAQTTSPDTKNGTRFAWLFQFTLGLGPIQTERIERRHLMKKAFLRRHRYSVSAVKQQDRLSQLQVPVANGEFLAFEGGDRELRAFHVRKHLAGIAGGGSACRFADHANRRPDLHVACRHGSLELS